MIRKSFYSFNLLVFFLSSLVSCRVEVTPQSGGGAPPYTDPPTRIVEHTAINFEPGYPLYRHSVIHAQPIEGEASLLIFSEHVFDEVYNKGNLHLIRINDNGERVGDDYVVNNAEVASPPTPIPNGHAILINVEASWDDQLSSYYQILEIDQWGNVTATLNLDGGPYYGNCEYKYPCRALGNASLVYDGSQYGVFHSWGHYQGHNYGTLSFFDTSGNALRMDAVGGGYGHAGDYLALAFNGQKFLTMSGHDRGYNFFHVIGDLFDKGSFGVNSQVIQLSRIETPLDGSQYLSLSNSNILADENGFIVMNSFIPGDPGKLDEATAASTRVALQISKVNTLGNIEKVNWASELSGAPVVYGVPGHLARIPSGFLATWAEYNGEKIYSRTNGGGLAHLSKPTFKMGILNQKGMLVANPSTSEIPFHYSFDGGYHNARSGLFTYRNGDIGWVGNEMGPSTRVELAGKVYEPVYDPSNNLRKIVVSRVRFSQ